MLFESLSFHIINNADIKKFVAVTPGFKMIRTFYFNEINRPVVASQNSTKDS